MALNIVIDGRPGIAHDGAAIQPEGGRFVDVENDFGESVSVGEWSENGDGTWTLRIEEIPQSAIPHMHDARGNDPDTCGKCGLNFRARIHAR